MKRVALIQSQNSFTNRLNEKYLGNIQILTSVNAVEIYKFIKKNANKNCILNYVLHVNSGVLSDFIDYIYNKKNKSINANALLHKCTFVATYSNADVIREKNMIKRTNIYFSLSPASSMIQDLSSIPSGNYMLVVSDTDNPYFNQLFNADISPKYRISQLSIEKINQFSLTGFNIIIGLNTENEFRKFTSLILESNFTKQLTSIELNYPDIILELQNKLSLIKSISSGVSISIDSHYTKDINNLVTYENNAIAIVNVYEKWNQLIELKMLSLIPSKFNATLSSILSNNNNLLVTDLQIKNNKLTVEVVSRLGTGNYGLSGRTFLPENNGMLFVFDIVSRVSFSNKDTALDLDLAFLDTNGIILEIAQLIANDKTIINSKSDKIVYAIETNVGWINKNGIQVGDKVDNLHNPNLL
jgi:uncharacterized membrane protein (UPF0127 family)